MVACEAPDTGKHPNWITATAESGLSESEDRQKVDNRATTISSSDTAFYLASQYAVTQLDPTYLCIVLISYDGECI